MSKTRKILGILTSRHTIGQKINYLKYLGSTKREILDYDPVTISIVATGRCTLACDMCPTHSTIVPRDYPHIQKNVKDMTLGMFREIIDRFGNALTVHIIGSGEPLLNKDFFAMVDYAAGKHMTVKVFSNGTVIEENIKRILDSRLDGITISINGHSAEEFKRMTGMDESVYHRIYAGTKRLIEEKRRSGSAIKVKLSFIIDRVNYLNMHEMIDLSLQLGADHAFFCNFLPSPYSGLSVRERTLLADALVIGEMRGAARRYPPHIRKHFTMPLPVDLNSNQNNCDTHFSQIRFDGDGNVSSCSMMLLDMTGHGNYRDPNVWNNVFFRDMRRTFLLNDKSIPIPCKACPDNKGVRIVNTGGRY